MVEIVIKVDIVNQQLPIEQPKSTIIDFGQAEIEKKSSIPDGGWGWFVLVAALAIRIVCGGLLVTFGLFLNCLVSEYQTSQSVMSWLASLMSAMNLAAAPIGDLLSSKLSNRMLVIIGSIFAGIAFAAPYFYSPLWFLFLSSILTGTGMGIVMMCTTVVLTTYFDKHLSLVLGIFTSGTGLASFIITPLFEKLIHSYGWRFAMLIYGLLFFGCAICALPFKQISNKKVNNTKITHQVIYNIQDNKPTNDESSKQSQRVDENNDDDDGDVERKNGNVEIGKEKNISINDVNKRSPMLLLLKNRIFWIFLIGNFLTNLGFDTTFIFAKVRAMNSGIEESKAAFLLIAIGIGNTLGRLIFGYLGSKKCIKTYILYCVSLILSGGFLLFSSAACTYPLMLVYTIGFGLFIGSYVALTSVVLVKIVGLNDFSRGLALTSFIQAIGLLICSPLSGLIYDMTKTFDWSFVTSGTLILGSGLIMLLAYCFRNFRDNQ